MPAATTKPTAAKRFELPALDFKFSSLTEGTDIPPPLPSPVREVPTPPQTPPAGEDKENDVKAKGANSTSGATTANGAPASTPTGTKRPADDTPLSPALSSRQGSIRRLFSRNLLNNAYAEGESHANGNGSANGSGRPGSRSNGSILDEKKAKRGSGWFRRLRSGDGPAPSKRSSLIFEDASSRKEEAKKGPPPPMIPELTDLEAKLDDGGLGDDLFKNIK